MSEGQAKLNIEKEFKDIFQKLAWDNDTTPPQLLKALIRSLVDYIETEGEMPTPFKIVPKREYEEFELYRRARLAELEAAATPGKTSAPVVKTASPSKTSGRQAS